MLNICVIYAPLKKCTIKQVYVITEIEGSTFEVAEQVFFGRIENERLGFVIY